MSLDQLYAQAVVVAPIFRVRLQRLAAQSRGHFYLQSADAAAMLELKLWTDIENDDEALARVCWTAIKHVDLAQQKATLYQEGNISRICDIVRERIIFDSLEDILTCVNMIANDPDLHIIKITNRFDPDADISTTAGYRDVVLKLRVVSEATNILGVSGHCCELQLAQREIVSLITPSQHHRWVVYKIVTRFQQNEWWGRPIKGRFFIPSRFPFLSQLRMNLSFLASNRIMHQGSKLNANYEADTIMSPAQPGIKRRLSWVGDILKGKGKTRPETKNLFSEMSAAECIHQEGVSWNLDALDPAGPDMKEKLTTRVYDIIRARCHLRGDMLDSVHKELRQALASADTTMILFVRPVAALCRWQIQLLLLIASAFFVFELSRVSQPQAHFEARHVRFRISELRSSSKINFPEVKFPNVSLLAGHINGNGFATYSITNFISISHLDMCQLYSPGTHRQVANESSLLISMPNVTAFNGWSMTSSMETGSEPDDPVRFDFSIAILNIEHSAYGLSDCLIGNSWRTVKQVAMLSPADQRAAIVEELRQRLSVDASSLNDGDLLRQCIPAERVHPQDWHVISASGCQWGVHYPQCFPRPDTVFEYFSLGRGFTHIFDLRPPWYLVLSIVNANYPLIAFTPLCALMGFLGFMWTARIMFSLCFLIPGTSHYL